MQHRGKACPHCDENSEISRQFAYPSGEICVPVEPATELFVGAPPLLRSR
jgi:hypothetical protein